MTRFNLSLVGLAALAVAGCSELGSDKAFDRGPDSKDLLDLQAGIWVDPNGCDHWIIDDGIEGYLSARLDRNTGKPVCSGVAAPTQTVGDFKRGGTEIIGDPF
ncbi:hypothetical protein [Roseobacter sp.]|uniref:hypothetical protein n=1 Tax=Roseobacter sp. TaxID=1907202 RepID=UPI0026079BF4|nr:hypothetical protein [Roseobacter sp.]MDW3182357.1 hypothetical protein [Roseobacter sp.]